MKVFYNVAHTGILEYFPLYKEALRVIQEAGHEVVNDWIPDAYKLKKKNKFKIGFADQYQDIMFKLRSADVCIFDVTVRSLSIGHQLTYAIERRKPVLLVSNLKKSSSISSLSIAGIHSVFLSLSDYQDKDALGYLIAEFLTKNTKKPKSRITVFVQKLIAEDFIDFAKQQGISRSALLEHMVFNTKKLSEKDFVKQGQGDYRLDFSVQYKVGRLLAKKAAQFHVTKTKYIEALIFKNI